MENLYDIRAKKKHLYILSDSHSSFTPEDKLLTSVAVAVNLYYEDTAEKYFTYLESIPEKIDLYIISSQQSILECARHRFKERDNFFCLEKENRGRDISALLVAFREIALKYQFICFVHDKKSKYSCLDADVERWVDNLWGNTVASAAYVLNVLQMFERNAELGLLVPPEPIGEYLDSWYSNSWYGNYNMTQEIVKKLQLKCNLDKEKSPITLGTVFWARTRSIEKLVKVGWQYEDFLAEPLPKDGTISHAIERILGYVSQDAGYETGTIMTNTYAETFLLYLQDAMQDIAKFIESKHYIRTIYHVRQFDKQKESIMEFFQNNDKVYLYGAGMYGKKLLDIIRTYGLEPNGFVVTSGKKEDRIKEIPVYELSEIKPTKATGIIIAVNFELQKELEEILIRYGHSNYIFGYDYSGLTAHSDRA